MSKRSRGPGRPSTHRRPGTRPPTARPAGERTARGGTSQLEQATVIAEDLVDDRPEAAAKELDRVARTQPRHHRTAKAGSLLAAKAATEYVYVAQDLRRITIVAGLLFGFLFVAWLLIVVLRLVPLPFY